MDNNIEKEEVKTEEEQVVFGSPIDNGSTSDLRESVNEMQTIIDEPTVEGPKKETSKVPIIIIIVLLVICLGLGIYIGYDKLIANSKCTKCDVPSTPTAKEKYDVYLKNISERTYAERIVFEDETDTVKEYILGTDNKLYVVKESSDTVIPGAKGNGGNFEGTFTDIEDVVRIYKVNHTDGKGTIEDESLGLLLVKKDGSVSIIRHPDKDEVKEETLDEKYIIDTYTPVDNESKTALIDIDGNITILK